jgi:hypothetical protein
VQRRDAGLDDLAEQRSPVADAGVSALGIPCGALVIVDADLKRLPRLAPPPGRRLVLQHGVVV